MLSYLAYRDQCSFFETCKAVSNLGTWLERKAYAQLCASGRFFGREQWEQYWGATITDQYDADKIDGKVLRTFLRTYYGPNPIDKGLVKDACLIVTVVPTEVFIEGERCDYNLDLLNEFAKKPKTGHAATYGSAYNHALPQHGKDKAERVSLVMLLKGVVGRGQYWDEEVRYLAQLNKDTHYGCETEPDGLSQITVVLAHHAVTGERPLGDYTGMEGQMTCGRTKELVRVGAAVHHMTAGCFLPGWGSDNPALLSGDFDGYEPDEGYGIMVMKKF